MFNSMTCGTMTCCPSSVSGKVVLYDDGAKSKMVENKVCFVLCPSPVPCCMYCGVGPCAQEPKFNRVSDTLYEGTGESMMASGACVACCHNKGDKVELKDGGMVWTAGTNNIVYPPCVTNKECVKFVLAQGGAPAVAEMER